MRTTITKTILQCDRCGMGQTIDEGAGEQFHEAWRHVACRTVQDGAVLTTDAFDVCGHCLVELRGWMGRVAPPPPEFEEVAARSPHPLTIPRP